jgi:predicted kinase
MLVEGVYDKWIFKAVFLAGGPGSGKTLARKLLLHNFKSLDPDELAVLKMKRENMSTNFKKRSKAEEERRDVIHTQAKEQMLGGKQKNILQGRLPIVVDRTGADYPGLEEHKRKLEDLGYETKMIFIDTPLNVAHKRNLERKRKMKPEIVDVFHKKVRSNVDKFRSLFGGNLIIIDSTKPFAEIKSELDVEWKKISRWMKQPVNNPKAKKWKDEELKRKDKRITNNLKKVSSEIKRNS